MIDERYSKVFPERLNMVSEARAPFAAPLQAALPHGAVELIYTPSYETFRTQTDASILALTEKDWLLLEVTSGGELKSTRVDFTKTLWIELTGILLYGKLEISFLQGQQLTHVSIVFNTVRMDYYLSCVRRILRGMRGLNGTGGEVGAQSVEGETSLPFKFRSALQDLTPPGEVVRSLLSWPTQTSHLYLGIEREEAPATLLVLTEQTLLIVREDLTDQHAMVQDPAHYGKISNFIPLQRLRGYSIRDVAERGVTELAFHVATEADHEVALPLDIPMQRSLETQAFLSALVEICKGLGVQGWHSVDFRIGR